MSSPIVHIEISGRDPKASAAFYENVFGWKIQTDPTLDYTMFDATPGPGGGFMKVDGEMFKSGDTLIYIGVEDIEATLAKIEAAGGKALAPKMEIPNVGWFAIFLDAGGTRMALYTPMNPQGSAS